VHPIRVIARVLGVSTFGFYRRRDRQPSSRQTRDPARLRRVRVIHAVSHGTYGARRVHAESRAEGAQVRRKRVARPMREAGIAGVSRRRRAVATTIPAPERTSAGDLVRRDFTADGPDRSSGTDIPSIPTAAGCLFLAARHRARTDGAFDASPLDAWSRRIVGWAFGHEPETRLVLDALDMAVASRKPRDVIHHSDEGSQGGLNRSSQRWHFALCPAARPAPRLVSSIPASSAVFH
jgi:putative transposase